MEYVICYIFYAESSSSDAVFLKKFTRDIFENVANVQKYSGLALPTILLQAEASVNDPPLVPVTFQIEEAMEISIPLQFHPETNVLHRLDMSCQYGVAAWIEVGKSGIRGSFVGREQLFKEQTLKIWTRIFISILEDMTGNMEFVKP